MLGETAVAGDLHGRYGPGFTPNRPTPRLAPRRNLPNADSRRRAQRQRVESAPAPGATRRPMLLRGGCAEEGSNTRFPRMSEPSTATILLGNRV